MQELDHSEQLKLLQDQTRLKEAFGMQLEDKNGPSKDEFGEMVIRFYNERAKEARIYSFVVAEINVGFQIMNIPKIADS